MYVSREREREREIQIDTVPFYVRARRRNSLGLAATGATLGSTLPVIYMYIDR